MAKPKRKKGVDPKDDGKQGGSRIAFGHDIIATYDGEGSWSAKVFYEEALRHTISGLRYAGEALWAGDDWAHLHRVLAPEAKLIGRDFFPIIHGERGVEVARLAGRPTEVEALDYARQYIEQLREIDRQKVARKQERRAEYIIKMEEFDAIDANIESKIADLKDALKLSQERRAEWIESTRNPQIEINFTFDRKRARQVDIEDTAARLSGLPEKPDPTSASAVLLGDCLDEASKIAAEKERTDKPKKRPPPRSPGADAEETGGVHP